MIFMYMYTPSGNRSFTTEAHLKPNANFTVLLYGPALAGT